AMRAMNARAAQRGSLDMSAHLQARGADGAGLSPRGLQLVRRGTSSDHSRPSRLPYKSPLGAAATSHRPSGSATASSATSTRWGLDTTRAGRRPPSSLIQTPVSVARYTRWGVTGSNATAYTRGSTSSDRHVTP